MRQHPKSKANHDFRTFTAALWSCGCWCCWRKDGTVSYAMPEEHYRSAVDDSSSTHTYKVFVYATRNEEPNVVCWYICTAYAVVHRDDGGV